MKTFLAALALTLTLSPFVSANELAQQTATRVQRAQNLQQDNKVDEAIVILANMNPSRAFDKAYVDRMLGVFYWQDEQYELAVKHLKSAVESNALEEGLTNTTRQMLADILLSQQQYQRALPHYYQLTSAFEGQKERSLVWLRISQSHYQLEQWEKVLSSLEHFQKTGAEMEVTHYRMKLGSQLPLEHWKGAASTLDTLIQIEPTEVSWWQRLAGIQMQLGRHKAAMQTLAIAHHNKLPLQRQDKLSLVQLYGQQGMPDRAARLYASLKPESAQELATLGTYWQMAKEWDKAIATYSKAADKDNKHRLKLAQLQLQQRDYDNALKNLNRVNDPTNEHVLLAKIQVLYRTGETTEALKVAQLAYQKTASASSKSWVNYLSKIAKTKSA